MLKEIHKKEFEDKILKKDGDFRSRVFDFSFDLSDWLNDGKIDFEVDFSGSIFKKDISFAKVRRKGKIRWVLS